MTYYHCPEEKGTAAYTEVRAAEINHRKWKVDCNPHPCLRMENHANAFRETQKPEIRDPERTTFIQRQKTGLDHL